MGINHSYHKFFTSVYINNLILKHTSSVYSVYSPNQEVLFQKGHQNRKYFSPRGHHTGSLIPEWSTQQEATFREGVDLFSLASYSLLSIHILSLYSNFVLESVLKAFPSFFGGRQCSEFFFTQKNSEARSVLKYIFFFWNIFPDWILQLLLFSLLVIVSHWRSCLVTIS